MNLDKKSLKACLKVAPTKDLRSCLNGVYVEIGDRIQYTATDGKVFFTTWEPVNTDWRGSVITPVDVVRAAAKASTFRIPLQPPKAGGFPWMLGCSYFNPIDSQYPNFRRNLVGEPTTGLVPVDPELVMRLRAAFAALGVIPLRISLDMHPGLALGMVGKDTARTVGIVMGLRERAATAEAWEAAQVAACVAVLTP